MLRSTDHDSHWKIALEGYFQLQALINDTQNTLDRFEATGMDKQMPEDYETLWVILAMR